MLKSQSNHPRAPPFLSPGGDIGTLLPRYRIFGDTVNVAARMQSSCEPGREHLSPSSAAALALSLPPDIVLIPRGEIAVKGKVRATLHLTLGHS